MKQPFSIKIWNHPIETTMYKWLFGVPGNNVLYIPGGFLAGLLKHQQYHPKTSPFQGLSSKHKNFQVHQQKNISNSILSAGKFMKSFLSLNRNVSVSAILGWKDFPDTFHHHRGIPPFTTIPQHSTKQIIPCLAPGLFSLWPEIAVAQLEPIPVR